MDSEALHLWLVRGILRKRYVQDPTVRACVKEVLPAFFSEQAIHQ
jgi:hypothetical protein